MTCFFTVKGIKYRALSEPERFFPSCSPSLLLMTNVVRNMTCLNSPGTFEPSGSGLQVCRTTGLHHQVQYVLVLTESYTMENIARIC